MKKIISLVLVVSVIGVFISCKSIDYAQPSFDRANSYVIDSYSVRGSLEDNVRIFNRTTRTNISFTVYVHDPDDRVWKEYGTGNLKGPGDADFISSRLSGNLDDYRYFAIRALDGRNYRYSIDKSRNDLYIYIYER